MNLVLCVEISLSVLVLCKSFFLETCLNEEKFEITLSLMGPNSNCGAVLIVIRNAYVYVYLLSFAIQPELLHDESHKFSYRNFLHHE